MLKTCYNPECRKMFSSSGIENLCHKCQSKEDELLQSIKGYLEEHPGASVMDIHHGTEIPMELIEHLQKAGRLNMVVLPKCTRCGQSITDTSSKTMCFGCAKDMQNQFASELIGLKPAAASQNLPSSGRGNMSGSGRRDDNGRSYGLGGSR